MDCTEDFIFYQKVVSKISGSLDLAKSMISVFNLLKDYFPIEGISLHQYSSRLRALKLLFLVTQDHFNYVESTLPLSPEGVLYMDEYERGKDPVTLSDHEDDKIVDEHRRAIAHLLPYKQSTYLIGIMRAGKNNIGHLCLIGKDLRCFTEDHIRKMRLLLGPFTLAMSNMLQFKRTLEFQKKLYAEKSSLEKELRQLRHTPIIGSRGGLHPLMNVVRQLKGQETLVLILGETGTGKELIADTIQKISPRADKPFVKVNCGAIPESLIDSELFGYEKGAFTGATRSHPGRFEQADGGTLFLDEVGELPAQAQVRLLRVLQNGVVERLGGKQSISVDVRIIAATNRNLESMLQKGTFREDLYYRLFVFPLHVPPLRNRTQDLPELVHHFIAKTSARLKIATLPVLDNDSLRHLKSYSWPGNVRELENLVERAVILSTGGTLQLEKYLPQEQGLLLESEQTESYLEKLIDERIRKALDTSFFRNSGTIESNSVYKNKEKPLNLIDVGKIRSMEETIRDSITAALVSSKGRVQGPKGAADLLSLNPSTLRNKMRKFGIKAKSYR